MAGGGRESGQEGGGSGEVGFLHVWSGVAGKTGRVDRKEVHVGNGEGGFHRWNGWVDILFLSNDGSPS